MTHLLLKITESVAVNAIDLVHSVVDRAVKHPDQEPAFIQYVAAFIQLPLKVEGKDTRGFIW